MKPSESDLVAAYEYLARIKPFSGWNLPESNAVEFEINRSQMLQGEYSPDPHTIKVSSEHCKTQQSVLETVAHEMVHLHLERARRKSPAVSILPLVRHKRAFAPVDRNTDRGLFYSLQTKAQS